MTRSESVVWHELECGIYREDLAFWRGLAEDSGDPVLDVGAGTGRVTLELAGHGHRVVALDVDPELLAELERHAAHLGNGAGQRVRTVCADARSFELPERDFALCVVPMQTIQLLGGSAGRLDFLRRAVGHLVGGGVLAVSLAPEFEEFDAHDGFAAPLADVIELDGTLYWSQPTAVRRQADQVVIERQREVVDASGHRRSARDRVALDVLGPAELIAEGARCGLRPVGTHVVPPTDEHIGSLVVIFRA